VLAEFPAASAGAEGAYAMNELTQKSSLRNGPHIGILRDAHDLVVVRAHVPLLETAKLNHSDITCVQLFFS
jgi:hypothetical protein